MTWGNSKLTFGNGVVGLGSFVNYGNGIGSLTIKAGAADTVDVSNQAANPQVVKTLTIENPSQVTVHGYSGSAPNQLSLTISGGNTEVSISGSSSESLFIATTTQLPQLIFESSATSSVTVNDNSPLVDLTVDTSGGSVTVDGTAISDRTLQVDAVGTNAATVTFTQLGQMFGSFSVNGNGATSLIVNDQSNSFGAAYTVYENEIQFPFDQISYSQLASLTVQGSSGTDNYYIDGTAPGMAVTVATGSGQNTVYVAYSTGSLANLASNLVVNGGGPTTVILDDQKTAGQGSSFSTTRYTVSAGPKGVTGAVVQSTDAGGTVTFAGTGNLAIWGNNQDDIYDIESVGKGIPVDLATGTGDNTVDVTPLLGQRELSLLQSNLNIQDGGPTSVIVNDQDYSSKSKQASGGGSTTTYTIAASGVENMTLTSTDAPGVTITDNNPGSFMLNGNELTDTINVDSTAELIPVTIDTESASDMVNVVPISQKLQDLGAMLTVNAQVPAGTTVNIFNGNGVSPGSGADTYTITATSTSFADPYVVAYSNVKAVNLYGDLNGTYDIQSLPSGAAYSITAGTGSNVFQLPNGFQGQLYAQGRGECPAGGG